MKHTYSKEEALRIIISTAKEYKNRLENRNYLFVYRDRETNLIEFFEALFLPRNYQHLTGIEYLDSNGNVRRNSVDFYNKCVNNIIKKEEIGFRKDGTTQLKLQALPQLVRFLEISKMTTIYNGTRPKLTIERIAGTVNYCLGFAQSGKYFVPNSCLLEDIRKLGNTTSQILAIFSKDVKSEKYDNLCYAAKGVSFDNICLPDEISSKLCIDGLHSQQEKA